jgi:predicted ribosomally synthesized peptide with SipW-like signal peptide
LLSSNVAMARIIRRKSMRPYVLAIFTAALFALPTSAAFSQVDVEVGPGGVRVGPGYHRHYYNRYGEGRCAELRQACVHKGQLGEEGMGNCR